MILQRLPSTDYNISISLPENPLETVTIVVSDIVGDGFHSDLSYGQMETSGNGSLVVGLRRFSNYDRTLGIYVHDDSGVLLYEDYIEFVRPYATFTGAAGLAQEENRTKFYEQEALARQLIDISTGGFYFRKKVVSYDSLGGDIIPITDNIVNINKAWENGIKVYDAIDTDFVNTQTFALGQDRASIVITTNGYVNRRVGNDTALRWAPSDYMFSTFDSVDRSLPHYTGAFPSGNDYLFEVEVGYRVVPSDIVTATKLLIDSGQCTDQYIDRYISEYDTDQYRVKYSSGAFAGTGNRRVDMILSKYINGSGLIRAGVL